MKFFSTFKVFFKNYKLVLKVLLTQVLMIVAGVSILSLAISGVIEDVGGELVESGIPEALSDVIKEMVSSGYSATEFIRLIGVLGERFQYWGDLVQVGVGGFYYKLSLYSAMFFIWLIVTRFLGGLTSLPLNENLNEYCGSSYQSPFFWQYFKNLGRSSVQQLWSLLTEFLGDLIAVFAALGIYVGIFFYIGIWGLIMAVLVFCMLMAFRRAATAFWLPEMTHRPDNGVRESLRRGMQAVMPVFGRLFLKNFALFTVTLVLAVLVVLPGISLITVAASLIIFAHNSIFAAHIAMAEYFKAEDIPFYTPQT